MPKLKAIVTGSAPPKPKRSLPSKAKKAASPLPPSPKIKTADTNPAPGRLSYIHPYYLVTFLYLEPLMAFNGALMLLLNPDLYLSFFATNAVYNPDTQIVYDQLAATYLAIGLSQALILRAAPNNRKIWRLIAVIALCSDCMHLWAGWKSLAQEGAAHPSLWRLLDWVSMATLLGPMVLRVGFLMGIGAGKGKGKQCVALATTSCEATM